MTLKALWGNFLTGEISEANVLKLNATGNSFVKDINAQDRLTLSISKKGLGVADWNSILSEASTLIALVDDSKAWDEPGAVLGGGMLNKISGRVGDSLILQVMGLREYLAALICNPKLSGTYSNPNSGAVFSGTTWRGVMAAIMTYITTIPRTPKMFGPIDQAGDAGTGVQRPVLFSDGVFFADLLDSIRDRESPSGIEYLFPLRWTSPQKNKMEFITKLGTDENPQINFDADPVVIPLATVSEFKSIDFSLTISTEQMANRVLAQSKMGDFETGSGADLTSFSVDNGKPLLDSWYNLGQELETVDELGIYAVAQLDDLKTAKGSAEYSLIGEPAEWINHMGKKLIFQGEAGTEAEGYNITVRMTGLTFSPDSKVIKLQLMLPSPRYPRLPSDTSKKKSATNPSFAPISGGATLPNAKPGKYVPVSGVVKDEPEAPPASAIDSNDYTKNRITTGQYHTLAISQDGKLYSWGRNFSGALGVPEDENYVAESPRQVGTDADWAAVFANGQTSHAIKNDGTLWSWGANIYGRTGLGLDSSIPMVMSPAQTNIKDIKHIYFYASSVWVIKTDGTLWYTGYPQITEGGAAQATAFTKLGTKSNWVKLDYTPMAEASLLITRLDAAGVLWDENGAAITAPVGFKDFTILANNNNNHPEPWYLAIGIDNQLYSWGLGYHDANGILSQKNSPTVTTAVTDIYSFLQIGDSISKMPSSAFIVKNDGKLWRMGSDNDFTKTVFPPQEVAVDSGIDFKKLTYARAVNRANSGGQLFVISENGELWGLGRGNFGTGNSDILYTTLTKLSEETIWKRLRADTARVLAVLNDDMYVTGDNSYGHLGMGSRGQYYSSWTIQPSST